MSGEMIVDDSRENPHSMALVTAGPMPDMTMGGMVKYTPTSLTVVKNLDWDQLTLLATMLQGEQIFSQRHLPWYEGDLLNWAEQVYGEAYPQLILDELNEHEHNTLRNRKFVCANVPAYMRRTEAWLTFSHHAEVASLPSDEEKMRVLELAARNHWRIRQLREYLREWRKQIEPPQEDTDSPYEAPPPEIDTDTKLQVMGLAWCPANSAIYRLKTEGLRALASYVPRNTAIGKIQAKELFILLDGMLNEWYDELGK